MSRRKPMAVRKPGGRIYSKAMPQLPPPSETRRLRDAALSGMRSPEWGTQLGRLHLEEKISGLQYSAGKRWAALVQEFAEACQCPRQPGSPKLDPSGGTAPEPGTIAGDRIVRKHARTIQDYNQAYAALEYAGTQAMNVTRGVTESELAPVGWAELQYLKDGLQHLVVHWDVKRKR